MAGRGAAPVKPGLVPVQELCCRAGCGDRRSGETSIPQWHFLLCIWYADDIVNAALRIGGTPYRWIVDSDLPAVQFGSFNSVLLVFIGVLANGSVALIALILLVILAWNYLKLLLEAAERYITLGILVFTAPVVFALGASRSTNNIFRSWCRVFGSQLFLLIMNAWCLKLFTNMVAEFLANPLAL